MKENVLKIVMALSFVICTYAFISIRLVSPAMLNLILAEPAYPEYEDFTTYGEHYYNASMIRLYREDMPQSVVKFRFSGKMATIDEADLLMFGDSHFDFARQPSFPERIGDSLGIGVYYDRHRRPYFGNILSYLDDKDYYSEKPKFVIYESSERYIPERFHSKHRNVGKVKNQDKTGRALKTLRYKIFNPFSNNLYEIMLKKAYITESIYSWIGTFKFNLFHFMPSLIAEYTVNGQYGPRLFHRELVEFYNRTDINEALVHNVVNNIKDLQVKLREDYNLELIFFMVPEKYTMFNVKNNLKPYHNFLPLMYKELERQGIPYVDLYTDFTKSDQLLYYRTDTHWNAFGVDIAVDNALQLFQHADIQTAVIKSDTLMIGN